jgi:predicted deacylase
VSEGRGAAVPGLRTPEVVTIDGARPGPRVVITSGGHGGEFVGIEAVARLAAELEAAEVSGQVVLCPVANPPAVYGSRTALSPLDQVNMNRVFPGSADGGPTEQLAAWLFETLLPGADAYLDLHSGGIDEVLCDFTGYRTSGVPAVDATARELAQAVGYEYVVRSPDAKGGNSHAAAARAGIPAVLIETGELGRSGKADVDKAVVGVRRALAHLGVLNGAVSGTRQDEWVWVSGITAGRPGLWYPAFAAGDDVDQGELIGRVVDPVSGETRAVLSDARGRVLYGMHGRTVGTGAELAAIAAPADGAA